MFFLFIFVVFCSFFAYFLKNFYSFILFIFNTLSLYIVLKNVKMRKLFCRFKNVLYICIRFQKIRNDKKIDNLN